MKPKRFTTKQYLAQMLLILVMLGLVGCGSIEVGAVDADSPDNSSIEVGIEPTPMPEMHTYTNEYYGFKFDFPNTWTLSEEDHGVVLMKDTNRLGINFRWVNENIHPNFGRTGMGGGTPIYTAKLNFLGQLIPENVVELDHLRKYVIYSDTNQIEIDDLVFAIVLEDLETNYTTLDLPQDVIEEARTILETFERIAATGTPPDDESADATTEGAPALSNVVAWRGHIASLPEGSQYDDMVMLIPEGAGEFGLTGVTPEIEAEIQSLRDAEGSNEYIHFWGALTCGGVDDYNDCQLVVDRMQYGANFSEEKISDWIGTITSSTFNMGLSYVFELDSYFPMWFSINASQNESLQAQIKHYFETGDKVEVSGNLMVGVPDVNGTRIEISSIEFLSMAGPRPDVIDGSLYENQEYGFSFQYSSHMSVAEEPNRVLVTQDNVQLIIAFRRLEESISIADVGELSGQFQLYNEMFFLGQIVKPSLNINEGRITAVYLGGPGIELGEGTPLRFVISLVTTDGDRISNAQVDEMLQIFQSFRLASG
ncbi:MAG: hypothetical protein GQ562_02460, partial [Anaerolineales bacterium]|nr:hypothetical protein [Anaerolineales bacterium]